MKADYSYGAPLIFLKQSCVSVKESLHLPIDKADTSKHLQHSKDQVLITPGSSSGRIVTDIFSPPSLRE